MKNLNHFTEVFLSHCKHEKQLSIKTLKAYKTDLNQLLEHFVSNKYDLKVSQITKVELKSFIETLCSLKPKSLKRKLATLKTFFNYLDLEEEITTNPFRKMYIKIKEPKLLPIVMDQQEINEIFRIAYSRLSNLSNDGSTVFETIIRDIVVLELLFTTGARVSEISNIKVNNLDLSNGNLIVLGKGNKERVIQICNPKTLKILRFYFKLTVQKYKNRSEFFLLNRKGKKLSDQSIRNMTKKITLASGIKKNITPHKFRHTFATLLLENDVDIKYIQSILGHSSIMTTQIYTHVNREKQRQILSSKHPRNDISLSI